MRLLTISIVLLSSLTTIYLYWRFRTVRTLIATVAGSVARFCSLLSRIGLQIATACTQGFVACFGGIEPSESERRNSVSSVIGAAVARLVYLVTSSILVLAGFPLDVLRTAAFYGLTAAHVGLQLDTLTALTWILMPGSWGLLLLETVGILPVWAQLLPQIHKRKAVTVIVGIIAAILFVLSLITTFLFHVFTQCQLLAPACTPDPFLQVVIAGSFNTLLILAACTLGVIGIIIGLLGLLGWILAFCSFVCFLMHLAFGLIGSLLLSLTSIRRLPDGSDAFPLLSEGAAAVPLLPASLLATTIVQDNQIVTDQEDDMAKNLRTNTIIGFGDSGYRLVPLLIEIAHQSGAAVTLLTAGTVDIDRIYRNETPLLVSGVTNVSPSRAVIHRALAEGTGNGAYTQLAYGMNEQIIGEYSKKHGGVVVFVVNLLLVPFLAEPIRKLKVRLPNQHIMVVTSLPPKDQQDHLFRQAYEELIGLADPDDINPIHCIVFDPNSLFSLKAGEETQEKALAGTILGLCVAPLHDERNATAAEVGKRLSNYSPLTGMAFSTATVASGKTPLAWRVAKAVAPTLGNRGYGDMHDLLIQVKECIKQGMADVDHQCPASAQISAPVFLLCTVPMPLTDKRFTEIVASIHSYCKKTYQNARALVIRGNAPTTPGSERGYRCGVTALYGSLLLSFGQNAASNTALSAEDESDSDTSTVPLPLNATNPKALEGAQKGSAAQPAAPQSIDPMQISEALSGTPSLNGAERRGRRTKLSE